MQEEPAAAHERQEEPEHTHAGQEGFMPARQPSPSFASWLAEQRPRGPPLPLSIPSVPISLAPDHEAGLQEQMRMLASVQKLQVWSAMLHAILKQTNTAGTSFIAGGQGHL